MRLRTDEIADAVGGAHHGPAVEVDGLEIDSRRVRGGELFAAMVAERDGHDFIPGALAAGAAAVLCAHDRPPAATAIVVEDTAVALGGVGRLARTRLPDRVIGITGSVGKTTVKDLAFHALSAGLRAHASEGSFNNEMGVPITLMGAPADVEAVVVEMGARGIGHIELLCSIARPTIAVVTVVAPAHTEMFGSLDQVAIAKGELVESLPRDGTAVLNADDPRVAAMATRAEGRVVRFGVEQPADVTAESIVLDDELRPRFRLRSPWGDAEVRLNLRGAHQVANALAAITAAVAAGVTVERAAEGAAEATGSRWRMALLRSPGGGVVLNDAYNANPTSMRAALDALAALPGRRRIAVLGAMAELGPESDSEHRQVAAYAESLGVEVLAVAAPAYERPTVDDVDAATKEIGPLGEGDVVLVKGSRVAGLERLAEVLTG